MEERFLSLSQNIMQQLCRRVWGVGGWGYRKGMLRNARHRELKKLLIIFIFFFFKKKQFLQWKRGLLKIKIGNIERNRNENVLFVLVLLLVSQLTVNLTHGKAKHLSLL